MSFAINAKTHHTTDHDRPLTQPAPLAHKNLPVDLLSRYQWHSTLYQFQVSSLPGKKRSMKRRCAFLIQPAFSGARSQPETSQRGCVHSRPKNLKSGLADQNKQEKL